MNDKEILAELKKSYEYMMDIRENGCEDHCSGQLENENIKRLEVAMNNIAEIYSKVREQMSDNECMINLKSGTYYIGNSISEDYSELYDNDNNYTYWVTCGDLDYYWFEDDNFIYRQDSML